MTGSASFWRWVIFALCVSTFGVFPFNQATERATEEFSGQTEADWPATNVWLQAADCARRTGAWLTICEGEELVPIAHRALADDPGHALFLGLKARLLDRPISLVDVATLNIWLDFFGMLALAVLLHVAGSFIASLVFLMLGSGVYSAWVGVSPHPGLIGVASFASVLPIAIFLSGRGLVSGPVHVILIGLGAGLLGLAALFREPIGTMGFLISVGALLFLGWKPMREGNGEWQNRRWLLLLFVVVLLSWQAPLRLVLLARDISFPMQPVALIQTHGISHTLYLGLGTVENTFGIRWDDEYAKSAVHRAHPHVDYVSPGYYRILWEFYFDRVREDPIEVGRIYSKKAGYIITERFPHWAPALWVALIGLTILLPLGNRHHLWRTLDYEQAPWILGVVLVFIGFFILQGVMAHQSRQYSEPISAFMVLSFAILLEVYWRYQRRGGNTAKSGDG
uniref:Glycosyltransferase RgtA/B/C/D-like domain-containing protein n=1 Tax=Candidatus Kentrum sp. FW TaxID=2126338 RepID=A0A450TCD5_9GAMM|nr:MAG: hypothetical protein BECKFW1821C_GA0114237_10067 [Candidatus Kentron sp. FW]